MGSLGILTILLATGLAAGFAPIPLSQPTTSSWSRRESLLKSTLLDEPTFTSQDAKRQVGNDAFLNKDLMARAKNGPGIKNEESLNIGIVGAGLAGMVAAMDLADAGHKVEMFETRPFVGGKVSSWKDKDGNHIEMGLHVFFWMLLQFVWYHETNRRV